MNLIELYEEYNKDGRVIKRQVNGIDYPADKFSSALIINATSVSTKRYMTKEEVKFIYGSLTPLRKE